ncbi:hypothetical protein LCGC14_1025220 [marine sediment metagenome]|uniref:HNH nuclease domain-containing protein n=1 Tax=marine sediment metagenome TaxID=412755 RepID=A0A0F9NHW9_9ZZZZ
MVTAKKPKNKPNQINNKGENNPFFGRKHTEETKQKMREMWQLRHPNFIPPMKGKKMSKESRRKMSEAAKKRPSNRIGKKHTLETRAKISIISRERSPSGRDAPAYKDGKVQERRGQRWSMQYKRWRYDVYLRDKFTCQKCGDDKGGNLVAHHIKPFADYPELRFDVENGLTICSSCHENIHTA